MPIFLSDQQKNTESLSEQESFPVLSAYGAAFISYIFLDIQVGNRGLADRDRLDMEEQRDTDSTAVSHIEKGRQSKEADYSLHHIHSMDKSHGQSLGHHDQCLDRRNQSLDRHDQSLDRRNQCPDHRDQILDRHDQSLGRRNQCLDHRDQSLDRRDQVLDHLLADAVLALQDSSSSRSLTFLYSLFAYYTVCVRLPSW